MINLYSLASPGLVRWVVGNSQRTTRTVLLGTSITICIVVVILVARS
jgi:hypothetical protein